MRYAAGMQQRFRGLALSVITTIGAGLSWGCGSSEEATPLPAGSGGSSNAAAGAGGSSAAGAANAASPGGSTGQAGTEGIGQLPFGSGGLSGAGGATSGAGGAGNLTPRLLWDITGVVGTGQSLAVGAQATTITATQPRFNNLKLALNGAQVPPFDASNPALSLVPLVEPIRPFATTYPSAYPANIYGQSLHAAMAAQITALAVGAGAADYVTAHTVVGESGQGMTVINKAAIESIMGATTTGRAYAASLFEASAITRLAAAAGKTYGIGAIVLTHGETDSGNTNYEADMLQLRSDYNQDLAAITGQTQSIPLITSQQHAYGFTAGVRSGFSVATLAQWQIGVNHPQEVVCAGPKYQYPYFTDNVHLVTQGYDLLGEKYGEVFFERVVLGNDWQPLQPTLVERNGRVLSVHFHVPVPPLTWDAVLPMPHQGALLTEWAAGRGFEVRNGATALSIESVAIVDDTVQITCAADVPAGAVVGYAATSDGTALPGVSVRWGQLKDSDALVGALTGVAQANYAVAFELTVP
jgi:hypothetical protein